ncbi:MAG: hypothetical protein U1E65_26125 [Myxococcota bacterium]
MCSDRRNEGDERRRRISLHGSARLTQIGAALSGLGFEIADDDAEDLALVETDDPTDVERYAGVPILVIPLIPLTAEQVRTLHVAGASQVLEPDAPLFDVLLAVVSSVFRSTAEQRRYWRAQGGIGATAELESGRSLSVRILGLGPTSLFLRQEPQLLAGAKVVIELVAFGAPIRLPGRVAYPHRDTIAVELFGGELPLSPRLEPVDAPSPRGRARSGSVESRLREHHVEA